MQLIYLEALREKCPYRPKIPNENTFHAVLVYRRKFQFMFILFRRNRMMWQFGLTHCPTSCMRTNLNPSCVWSTIVTNVCVEPATPFHLDPALNSDWTKETSPLKFRYACLHMCRLNRVVFYNYIKEWSGMHKSKKQYLQLPLKFLLIRYI